LVNVFQLGKNLALVQMEDASVPNYAEAHLVRDLEPPETPVTSPKVRIFSSLTRQTTCHSKCGRVEVDGLSASEGRDMGWKKVPLWEDESTS
jgi:hypothetical protein